MKTILRNVCAVIVGIVIGGVVNMALIIVSAIAIPPPPGVDVSDAKSLAAGMHLFEPKHFVFPFLAHALGTLVGSLCAFFIAGSHKPKFAYAIGAFFLAGGIAASSMIPAPLWFILLDLLVAYIPMAWLAVWIGRRMLPGSSQRN